MNERRNKGDSVTERLPVHYEPVDKDGNAVYGRYVSAQAAAEKARMMWPDQEQDPDRTGKGWDVQVVGS